MEALTHKVWLQIGPIVITETVVVSVVLTLILVVGGHFAVRSQKLREPLEVIYERVEAMVQNMVTVDAGPLVPLVLTQWVFILAANLVGVIPIIASPTRDLALTAALAVVALGAGHVYGFRANGWRYLRHYLEPNPIMLPFNLIGEVTRTLSLALRLFGNMLSGEIIGAIAVSLAGLLLPIPLMILDVLTSVVQAYIFGVLTLVFTASAMQVASSATPRIDDVPSPPTTSGANS